MTHVYADRFAAQAMKHPAWDDTAAQSVDLRSLQSRFHDQATRIPFEWWSGYWFTARACESGVCGLQAYCFVACAGRRVGETFSSAHGRIHDSRLVDGGDQGCARRLAEGIWRQGRYVESAGDK